MARRRLAFDELLRLQVILVMRKRAVEREATGIRHQVDGDLVDRFRAGLPFTLTEAQTRAIAEIRGDMAGPHPMHRLLQGDVGSGKTVVAVAALLTAVDGGHQGALMAPTEVLAEQHHAGISDLLSGFTRPSSGTLLPDRPLRVGLLTNRTPARERARLQAGLADGTVDVLVGTHALLTEAVLFGSLGAVVIDEQHRFGVEQRAALRDKGPGQVVPDVLVMTATPIPRTAAMTVYGDLDTTVLDELPPGRTPTTTRWARGPLEEQAAWDRVRAEVEAGRQAYVVCPLIEESERIQARSAADERDRLAAGELAGLRLGLLHGQLPAPAKDAVMADFRSGRIDVLVATTVVEVGVDVPNATVMVIEDAGRFGIAQLHQLRGRVGRGDRAAWCYPARRRGRRRRRSPPVRPRAEHRRVRAGRGRPGAPRGGHHPRNPSEGRDRPQAGLPAPGQGPGGDGPGGGVRPGRRRSGPGGPARSGGRDSLPGGRRGPRLPVQELTPGSVRGSCVSWPEALAGGRCAPLRAAPPGRRATGFARPCSRCSTAWRASKGRPCSTCSPGAAPSGSRRFPGGRPRATFVERDRTAVAAIRANLAVVGVGPDRADGGLRRRRAATPPPPSRWI